MRNILSVDVGLNNLGVAITKDSANFETFLIQPQPKLNLECKINHLYTELGKICKSFYKKKQNNSLLFEIPYFKFNSNTGKKLDYVVGILYLLGAQFNAQIHSYNNTTIKHNVGVKIDGKKKDREVNKDLVKSAVEKKLGISLPQMSDHEIDAIAIILCHLSTQETTCS